MIKMQKTMAWLTILGLLALLTACGPKATPTPTEAPTQEAPPTFEPTFTPLATLPPLDVPPTSAVPTLTAPPDALTPTAAFTLSAPPSGSTGSAADKYKYVSQSLPDGTQVLPGTKFSISWVVTNAGDTTWTTSYVLRFFSGPTPGATTDYNFTKQVAPGQSATLTAKIVAPQDLGDYNSWWKLTNDQGQNFGDVNFLFTVTNSPGSARTPTPAS